MVLASLEYLSDGAVFRADAAENSQVALRLVHKIGLGHVDLDHAPQ